MKKIRRIYYLMFKRKGCFRATLSKRLENKFDLVEYNDIYLGNDWYYRNT